MEPWELEAREAIRDLVARYNANGDSGRFARVVELFAEDAVLELDDGTYRGRDEILTVFTGVRDRVAPIHDRSTHDGPAPDDSAHELPAYLRHLTATHQIDVLDRSHASGRCYYQVLSPVGLDHWGRYLDTYRRVDDRWLFASRRATVDGASADSIMVDPAP